MEQEVVITITGKVKGNSEMDRIWIARRYSHIVRNTLGEDYHVEWKLAGKEKTEEEIVFTIKGKIKGDSKEDIIGKARMYSIISRDNIGEKFNVIWNIGGTKDGVR